MTIPLEIIDLSKTYDTKEAVRNISFKVNENEIIGILGPNGCGKTTTLRMIAGMLEPSKGTAIVDGLDVRKHKHDVKSKIGYMTNNTSLYDRLNVVETIKFFADLNQIPEDIYKPRAEQLFEQLDIVINNPSRINLFIPSACNFITYPLYCACRKESKNAY